MGSITSFKAKTSKSVFDFLVNTEMMTKSRMKSKPQPKFSKDNAASVAI